MNQGHFMTSPQVSSQISTLPSTTGTALDRRVRQTVLSRLSGIQNACLHIIDRHEKFTIGDESAELIATIEVHDSRFWRLLASGGSLGAGEAYMYGLWESDDLTNVIRVLARNRSVLPSLESNRNWFGKLALKLWHRNTRNSLTGSRKNIAAHYDLSNNFFKLWLDESMTYSSGWYQQPDWTLEQAQQAKLEKICQQLDLQPHHHVLEIGTGWGGFAIYAAAKYGCEITTTTISQAQYQEALTRIREAGLTGKIHLLCEDYRELFGEYDRVVSIEMVEAVGHDYVDLYFQKIASLLKDDGQALIQAITIEDHRYESAIKSVDFIKRYIFPGSFIPSLSRLQQAIKTTDMQVNDVFEIGQSYALTLAAWRERFIAHLDEVSEQGFNQSFIKMWLFYLCYCEGGFAEGALDDVQMHVCKSLPAVSEE